MKNKLKSNLSDSFYGSKKFLIGQYHSFQQSKTITPEQVKLIFSPYADQLSERHLCSHEEDNQTTLLDLFAEFIRANAAKFYSWPYQKLSSWLQLSAHVFQHSFENHLSKKESFQYFSQLLIRHSLFRPPHSVNVFTLEEAKVLKQYWLNNFVRFYDEYKQCFESQHNEVIQTIYAGFSPEEASIVAKKQISRQDFAAKFGKIVAVNQEKKKQ